MYQCRSHGACPVLKTELDGHDNSNNCICSGMVLARTLLANPVILTRGQRLQTECLI